MVTAIEKTALIEMVKAFGKAENLQVSYRPSKDYKTFACFEFFDTVASQKYTSETFYWDDVGNIVAWFDAIREQVMTWKARINNASKSYEIMVDTCPNQFNKQARKTFGMCYKTTYSPFDKRAVEIFLEYCKNEGSNRIQKIKKVHFNGPCTIVLWDDNTKTIVRAQNEVFDPEKGLAMAIAKKFLGGNKGRYFDEFKKWCKPREKQRWFYD